MPRVTTSARKLPPEWPHRKGLRERVVGAAAIFGLVWFALLVVTGLLFYFSVAR